jgi:hypothetical protein
MMIQTVAFALVKRVGTFLLGGVVLWQVAEHAGPSHGQAIVHVMSNHVDLIVDNDSYRIEDLGQSPIVCELRPGPHTVRLRRDGEVRYQEVFEVAAGEDTVLAVSEPHVAGPGSHPPADPRGLPPRHRRARRP